MNKLITLFLVATSLTAISQTNPKKHGIDISGGVPEGLKEGTMAPAIVGIDQNGQSVSLANQLKKGPVVLIFYRGYWCPVCNKYLGQFQSELDQILQRGASVIAVTPEANDGMEKTISKTSLTFSVLTDDDYQIMDAYGVRYLVTKAYSSKIKTFLGADIAANNTDEKPFLPIPATYIIGQDGKIKKVFFDQDYSKRPSVSEIVKYLN